MPVGPASVADLVAERARERPGAEAVVDGRHRLTYAGLDERVRAVASGLAARGLDHDHRIAVSLPNTVEAVVAFCAVMHLGASYVGVHPGLTSPEQRSLLDQVNADILLTTAGAADALRVAGPPLAAEVVGLELDGDGIAALSAPIRPLPPIDPQRPAAIAFTSGTTGRPKAVVHDQHHMVLPASVVSHERLGGRSERVGVHLPLTTLNVLIVGPILAFLGGGTCVCLDSHDPESLIASIQAERVDHLATAPAVVLDLLEHPGVPPGPFARLRLGVGGTDCPEELRSAYRQRFGREFTTGYGLTEAPTSVAQETERIPHVPGASGRAMAHVDIEILDEVGRRVPPGVDGEITVVPRRSGRWAGCWVGMHGYLDDPDATERALDGGRLRTGDGGHLDDAGNLHVTRRRLEVINRGGSKVAPAEIEEIVRSHPAVADCLVIGRPDPRLGETVAAVVELRRGHRVDAAELVDHCRVRLAGFKVPTDWEVVAELPRNPMGKVERQAVLDLFDQREAP